MRRGHRRRRDADGSLLESRERGPHHHAVLRGQPVRCRLRRASGRRRSSRGRRRRSGSGGRGGSCCCCCCCSGRWRDDRLHYCCRSGYRSGERRRGGRRGGSSGDGGRRNHSIGRLRHPHGRLLRRRGRRPWSLLDRSPNERLNLLDDDCLMKKSARFFGVSQLPARAEGWKSKGSGDRVMVGVTQRARPTPSSSTERMTGTRSLVLARPWRNRRVRRAARNGAVQFGPDMRAD